MVILVALHRLLCKIPRHQTRLRPSSCGKLAPQILRHNAYGGLVKLVGVGPFELTIMPEHIPGAVVLHALCLGGAEVIQQGPSEAQH